MGSRLSPCPFLPFYDCAPLAWASVSLCCSLSSWLKHGYDGWKTRSHPDNKRTMSTLWRRWTEELDRAPVCLRTLWSLHTNLGLCTFCFSFFEVYRFTVLHLFSVIWQLNLIQRDTLVVQQSPWPSLQKQPVTSHSKNNTGPEAQVMFLEPSLPVFYSGEPVGKSLEKSSHFTFLICKMGTLEELVPAFILWLCIFKFRFNCFS